MKSLTCNQLGGACDHVFTAETFDDMARQSQQHGMEMMQKGDTAHMEAMQKMKSMMSTPEAMQKWMEEKKALFDATPED
ncbi:MAG: hypothetical protein R2794_08980 [Chitinophagales bacterium]